MSVESALANVFGLRGEDAWHRHANPWSVYTRIPIPLMLVLAIWSRAWIGWWSLVPIGIVLAWTVINPRVFPPPRSLDHWASRAVLGETHWAARKQKPIPARHHVAPLVLSVISAAGLPSWCGGSSSSTRGSPRSGSSSRWRASCGFWTG